MEMLNKVFLRGIVGAVKTDQIKDRKLTRLSVRTERSYTNKSGDIIVECAWHSVTAWDVKEKISPRDAVEVVGLLRYQQYVGNYGEEKRVVEILADSVTKVNG